MVIPRKLEVTVVHSIPIALYIVIQNKMKFFLNEKAIKIKKKENML